METLGRVCHPQHPQRKTGVLCNLTDPHSCAVVVDLNEAAGDKDAMAKPNISDKAKVSLSGDLAAFARLSFPDAMDSLCMPITVALHLGAPSKNSMVKTSISKSVETVTTAARNYRPLIRFSCRSVAGSKRLPSQARLVPTGIVDSLKS